MEMFSLQPGESGADGSGGRRRRAARRPADDSAVDTIGPEAAAAGHVAGRRRLWILVALSVGLVWLAWEIFSTTAASTLSVSDPESALAWRPNAPVALMGWADYAFAGPSGESRLEEIESAAEHALTVNPLESDAMRLLGLVAEKKGDPDRAAALMSMAAARNPRDVRAQTWLFAWSAREGDYQASLRHVDSLLRARPDLGEPLLPALIELASLAEPAVVEQLSANPPWRRWFMARLSDKAADPSSLAEIFTRLRATSAPPTNGEIAPFLRKLVQRGHYDLAYLNWITHLPPAQLLSVGRLTNGGFEEPPSGLPFDWGLGRVRGAATEIVETGGDNRALRVAFHGGLIPYRHVSQTLLLPAGKYRLSGQVRPIGLRNPRGMQWTISCADTQEVVAETERVSGSAPWTDFAVDFEVPDGLACRAQVLRLALAARVDAEQEAQGEIWYDSLAIERLPDGEIATPSENITPTNIR
jgi:tetratricopeptide (TPR) repeat protein